MENSSISNHWKSTPNRTSSRQAENGLYSFKSVESVDCKDGRKQQSVCRGLFPDHSMICKKVVLKVWPKTVNQLNQLCLNH